MKNVLLFFMLSFFFEGVFGESVSVMEGDSVTLHTGLTEIQNKDDVLEWRFGAGRDRIARVRKDRDPTYADVSDERFRGRQKLDRQTGDLTITNITTEHAGDYEVSTTIIPIQLKKTFSVIVVSDDKKPSVLLGEYVTLPTGVTTQIYDEIQWRFGDKKIAQVNRNTGNVSYDVLDERFRDRLQLDYWTGSLTIINTIPKHTGVYEVDIIRISKYTIHKTFTVTVRGEIQSVSVNEGESITLETGTVLQAHDTALWEFGDTVILAFSNNITNVGLDGRFTDRLKLDKKTGYLTIMKTRIKDSGEYNVQISSSKQIIQKKFIVTVTDLGLSAGAKAAIGLVVLLLCAAVGVIYQRHKISKLKQECIDKEKILSVMEGESITLKPDDADVHKDDKLLWMFASFAIAERKSAVPSFTLHDDAPDGRFNGRLQLNDQTGSLTIPNTRNTDSGEYELVIIRPGKSSINRFYVSVFAMTSDIKSVSVKQGGSVTLPSGVTDIKTDDEIVWSFGLYNVLAEITRETKNISPLADGIFKGRLKLDHQTRSLIINKIKPTDAGIYMQRITRGGNISTHLFKVSVSDPTDNRNNSENVPLRSVETFPRL